MSYGIGPSFNPKIFEELRNYTGTMPTTERKKDEIILFQSSESQLDQKDSIESKNFKIIGDDYHKKIEEVFTRDINSKIINLNFSNPSSKETFSKYDCFNQFLAKFELPKYSLLDIKRFLASSSYKGSTSNSLLDAVSQHISKTDNPREVFKVWDTIIDDSAAQSPGRKLEAIKDKDPIGYKKAIEEQWLVKEPLTGICFGLAIEQVVRMSLENPETVTMMPSDVSRYYEKMMILVADDIMSRHSIGLDALTTDPYSDEYYAKSIALIKEKCCIVGKVAPAPHQSLGSLLDAMIANKHPGHSMLVLENPKGKILANHVVYFNRELGIIADGANGSTMRVNPKDFDAFFSYYIQKTYNTVYENFSLINVDKPEKVKAPGFIEQTYLKAQLIGIGMKTSFKSVADFLIKN